MKILNLYAGIGGNRKLWGDVDVTAVEIDPEIADIYSKHFKHDNVIVCDAHRYLLDNFQNYDFIWSSPPCQTHSRMRIFLREKFYPDMSLYQEIILLKHFFKGKFVIENVISYYDPLIVPIKFNRHYIWSNFTISFKNILDPVKGAIRNGASGKQILDVINMHNFRMSDSYKKRQIARNCVLPEVGKHVFDCAVGSVSEKEQLKLFTKI